MLKPFRVLTPTTLAEASSEIARLGDRGRVYAGGAELLLLLRHGLIEADRLINIKQIPMLNEINWDGRVLRIGATVTHHRLETDPAVRRHLPMFADAESQVANIRVRNQGTLGGNLCFNDPHSDPGTVLLVYEAKVNLENKNGLRQISLGDFLVGMYETALGQDELLSAIEMAPLPPGFRGAYLSMHRFQRPTLGVAAAAAWKDNRLQAVRLAVGCVGPIPLRLTELETRLSGATLEEAQKICGEAGTYLRDTLKPVDDLLGSGDYKIHMTRVFLKEALEETAQSKDGRGNGQSGRSAKNSSDL